MMKVHGIELEVGEKPPGITSTALLDFNDIFLRIFEAFEKNGHVVLYSSLYNEHCEGVEQLRKFGVFSVGKVWKNLRYKQMITAKKQIERYEEDGKPRKRSLTILEPTSLGIFVYENSQVIAVDEAYGGPLKVGVGKAYPTHNALWKRLEKMFEVAGIARSRKDKWYYEFKTFYKQNLLDKPTEEATELAIKWARQHIATAPTRHGRRVNKINRAADEKTQQLNESLGKWL